MSSTPASAGRVFRPRLWPTLATIAGLAVLLALGHLADAAPGLEAGSDRACARRRSPPPAHPCRQGDLAELDFRRVTVTGHYLHDAAFAFGFSAEDGRSGQPADHAVPARRWQGRPGRPRLDAEDLLPPHVPGGLQPAGHRDAGGRRALARLVAPHLAHPGRRAELRRWYGWDFDEMAAATGLTLEPLVIVLERSEGDRGPAARAAGRGRLPQRSSELCDHVVQSRRHSGRDLRPVQHDPIRWLPTVRAIRTHRRRHGDPRLCTDCPRRRRADHEFRPVLPRLADLLWPLAAAARRHRGAAQAWATAMGK